VFYKNSFPRWEIGARGEWGAFLSSIGIILYRIPPIGIVMRRSLTDFKWQLLPTFMKLGPSTTV